MISRPTWSLAIALSCAMLAACNETATAPEPEASDIQANVSAAAALSFSAVSSGGAHTCGLTSDQRLYCWGWNYNGQVGDGTNGNIRTRPVPVGGALRFRQVDLGTSHTCAITTGDLLYCWGWNEFGQLGNGTKSFGRSTPGPVSGNHRFRSVAGGSLHTCAISMADNRAYCWGSNTSGQLGDGTTSERLTPTPVRGTMRFRRITAGDHTCGLNTENRAFCWGTNRYGQLGDGTETPQRLTPTRVTGGRAFKEIDAGNRHTCAVTAADFRAFCWGDGRNGALGNGRRYLSFWPRAVSGGLTFDRVTAGNSHTCGETTGNRAYCWGYNETGALGDGTTTTRLTPVAVKGNHFFSQLSAGGHSCGRTAESRAYCWGGNEVGQLGDGTTTTRTTPTPVAGP
jgi:alpha-tubulin suppressor-like RCC1 family protein